MGTRESRAERQPERGPVQERGQSLVEMALLLPLLMTLLLAAVDFGRAFSTGVAIDNAARVGAAYALESRWTDGDIQAVVIREAGPQVALQPTEITIQRQTSPWDATETDVTVSIARQFRPVAPFTSRIWGGGDLLLRVAATSRQVPP